MITLSHPTGNAFVRHALQALYKEGMLHSFHTTLAWPRTWAWGGPTLMRRSYPIPYEKIYTQPIGELLRLSAINPNSIDNVYQQLDKKLARRLPSLQKEGVTTVYCYEDGAHDTFIAARQLGMRTFYDLPIGHYAAAQEIFQTEAQLKPEWASTLTGLQDSADKLTRKAAELRTAQVVVVASSFTAFTLKGLLLPHQKIEIIPYGTEIMAPPPPRGTSGPLKILYVGSLTQRKGISYLFDAVKTLPANSYRLTVVGRIPAPCKALTEALGLHTYIPSAPHSQILELMRAHDILVFPSLFEGFGLVLTEALSCGLPFIATAHTAAPDLITHGVEGFIIPTRSSLAIAERLAWALAHRPQLAAMQAAAYLRAQTLGWHRYENSLINLLQTYAP